MIDNEEATAEYSRIYSVWCGGFMSISMLLKAVNATLRYVPEALRSEFIEYATATVRRPGVFSEVMEDKFPNMRDDQRIEQMARNMAGGMIVRAQQCLSAAIIALGHSLLDAAATDYAKLSMRLAPGDWYEHLRDRKISVSRLRSAGVDEAILGILEEEMNNIDKVNLTKRIGLLRQRCLPAKNYPSDIPDYAYNPTQIDHIDNKRHRIMHDGAMHESLGDTVADTKTLRLTCLYLSNMLSNKYQLSINPAYFLDTMKANQERLNDEWLPTNTI